MRSAYTRAGVFLERYLTSGASDYESSYYYGEVLLRADKRGRARYRFQQSLEQIDAAREPSLQERVTRAQLLHRLGREDEAFASFAEL